jgi:hypothetical protein
MAGSVKNCYVCSMTDEPNNILLEYMRRFDARQGRFEDARHVGAPRLD